MTARARGRANGTDYRGYDWFKSGPPPNGGTSRPDPTANRTNRRGSYPAQSSWLSPS